MSDEALLAEMNFGFRLQEAVVKVISDEEQSDPFHNGYAEKRNEITRDDWIKILVYVPIGLVVAFLILYLLAKLGGWKAGGIDYTD